ncbi:MAG: leucine--tRNA ligase [Spirochaetes bacterium]|jgi:leucyl-tRNA synthetase|nr:leucine--tRNA ligase [Spirochaetota bacterium]
MNETFDFLTIEKKWIERWDESKEFRVTEDPSYPVEKRLYVLDMFPYPSGSGLHVGHPEGYTATDIFTRFKKMNGFNVLHPMGYDSFGLPAENYAIKTGTHPAVTTRSNIDRFRDQIKTFGFAYDWDREISTCEPGYYKWTQWIFLQLFKKGLAYESEMPINWCPDCLTGLANEEVKDGNCDRCGSQIERRRIRQWVLKITEYADRLLADLDALDWSESIKAMQENWIGRSEGAEVDFVIESTKEKLRVYTTRPDTLFGATYMVIAPEHSAVAAITTKEQQAEVTAYIEEAATKSDLQRTELNKDKSGVFTGAYAINPVNNERIPIWISDYVLISYGTGAIMAVPAHDTRDFEFAKKFDIPIIQVVSKDNSVEELEEAFTDEGFAVNSGSFNGLPTSEFKKTITEWLETEGKGNKAVNYKLRDWIFSRQRYWGEPIPLVHCGKCGIVPIDEKDLPLRLPEVESYTPTGTGESPLAAIEEWVNTDCPVCGSPAKRETNTMPQWAGSCWYYLRYMDPENDQTLVKPEALNYWGDVDLYVGGAEHAVLHLLYARFWHKVLMDCGVVSFKEPFKKLRNQGMILGENNEKMSKSRGNVINPDDIIAEFGADSLRMYEMFMGPLAADKPWNTNSIYGVKRFLEKVWRLQERIETGAQLSDNTAKLTHKTIKIVTQKIDNLDFNTAISQLMILVNTLQKEPSVPLETYKTLLQLLHPFAPFITEELWEIHDGTTTMLKTSWPQHNPEMAVDEVITIVFQINGKVRAREDLPADIDKATMLENAKNNDKIKQYLDGRTIIKEIVVPGKLVNIVIK